MSRVSRGSSLFFFFGVLGVGCDGCRGVRAIRSFNAGNGTFSDNAAVWLCTYRIRECAAAYHALRTLVDQDAKTYRKLPWGTTVYSKHWKHVK
jgi:hypothetical protein